MPKRKAKAKAQTKGKKTVQKQKQTVIVNVTKGGGKARASRPSAPRPQQIPQVIFQQPQQQFPQQERPHDTEIERENRNKKHIDDILNVIQQTNAIYRQQPPPQAVTTTNVDVGSILTGTATLAKTGLDIYRNYSRGQREQKEEQQREERRVDVPASNIPARPSAGHPPPPPPALPPRPARPVSAPPALPPRRVLPPVPLFPVKPRPSQEDILSQIQQKVVSVPNAPITPKLPRRQPVRSLRPEMPPRSSSTGGIRKSDVSDLEMKRRLEVLNPNLRGNPVNPVLPSGGGQRGVPAFHIKNILGQIELKGSISSSKQLLKQSRELNKDLNQLGSRSILGEQKDDNFDFRKRASQLRKEGIAMKQEGLKTIRQNAKSASSALERPSGPPIGGKRRSDLELRNPRKTQVY